MSRVDPDKAHHQRLQHFAFEYRTLDDLLGTYARLKELGILPVLVPTPARRQPFTTKIQITIASS